ncbi:GNAT family N-acetyltransferase [Tahibacter amnicola]|uniref:GNAT family N-acetyltransferase n=1 Tax=Tahibacter amnicola TaxID=2976241 RepID=A0ABY6BHR6_9GAMM|nr:GNAT family N-acetyltransferase [Tahibacter amnicola]UXI69390.1 GNAT family N-acetyltransferase [Tahibacter amnicola]
MPLVRITHRDVSHRHAFSAYVARVFPRISFDAWMDRGNWDDSYCAYALYEDDVIVANASVTQMRILVDGEMLAACQFGAVGCIPEARGKGFARRVVESALEDCGTRPVLLFANPTVSRFYPLFGFVPAAQYQFTAQCTARPSARPAERVNAMDHPIAAMLSERVDAIPVTTRFGAHGYHRTVSDWYVTNGLARPLRRLPNGAMVFCAVEDGVLRIDDIVAPRRFDLRSHIEDLIDEPIHRIAFGFTPEHCWPDAQAHLDAGAHLFLRNFPELPPGPSQFPVLART